jgi:adenylate cyclase
MAVVRKLDPEWPELYMASGWVAQILERDWPRAEADFKRALAINPNLAEAHASYGWMLNTIGRLTESERELRRAFELNPVADLAGLKLALVIYEQRRFRDALSLAQSVRAENSSQLYSSAVGQLVALSLVHLGRGEEAAREADRIAQLSEAPPSILAELYALTGRRQQALAMIERSRLKIRGESNPLAVAELALGNKEEALRVLESAVDRRDGVVLMSGNDIDLEPLWGDTRFKALLSRMGLPQAQPVRR